MTVTDPQKIRTNKEFRDVLDKGYDNEGGRRDRSKTSGVSAIRSGPRHDDEDGDSEQE